MCNCSIRMDIIVLSIVICLQYARHSFLIDLSMFCQEQLFCHHLLSSQNTWNAFVEERLELPRCIRCISIRLWLIIQTISTCWRLENGRKTNKKDFKSKTHNQKWSGSVNRKREKLYQSPFGAMEQVKQKSITDSNSNNNIIEIDFRMDARNRRETLMKLKRFKRKQIELNENKEISAIQFDVFRS